MQQHDIRITTGKGLEGLLPDGACYYIIADDIIPLLRYGQYGAGLLAGNQAVTQRLTTRQALQELLLGYRPKEPKEQPWKGLSLFALFVAMIAGLAYWAAATRRHFTMPDSNISSVWISIPHRWIPQNSLAGSRKVPMIRQFFRTATS
jgi:uncharacterized membrane protein YgcG